MYCREEHVAKKKLIATVTRDVFDHKSGTKIIQFFLLDNWQKSWKIHSLQKRKFCEYQEMFLFPQQEVRNMVQEGNKLKTSLSYHAHL